MTIADYKLHGFDISHYQPAAPDFENGGRRFGFCKATQGVSVIDPNLARNRAKAREQGLPLFGMYHYATPAKHAAEEEAAHFLNVIGQPGPGEIAVLDFEENPWSEDWPVVFAKAVKAAGWRVIFYSYRAMLAANPHDRIRGAFDGLWVAGYSRNAPVVPGWTWDFWQHTNGTDAPDPNSPAWDCSVFHSNNPDELAAFAGGHTQGDFMAALSEAEQKDMYARVREIHAVTAASGYIEKIVQWTQTHADDPTKGGGTGQIDYTRLETELKDMLADELAKRLAA